MLTLFTISSLLAGAAYAQTENAQYGASTTSTCASSQVAGADNACAAVGRCGAASAWLVSELSATETEAMITMVPGQVVGTNAIEMYAYHGAVNGRTVEAIVVNPNVPACNYPGPNWSKGVDDSGDTCFDVYRAVIPWTTAYQGGGDMAAQLANACGMSREENATSVYFEGAATVKMAEVFSFDGADTTRQIDSVIRFGLTQPRTITDITVTVTVLEDPRLLQAITEQLFDYNTGLATLTVKLSTAFPLKTTGDNLGITPPEGVTTVRASEDPLTDIVGCDSLESVSCQQDHTFTIDPQALCEFDGVYSFDFEVACRDGVTDCPIGMTQMPIQVNVTLDSEDICAVVTDLLEVSADMTSHGVFTAGTNDQFGEFGPPKSAFFQSQTMYFQLIVDSLNEFNFESTTIDEVRVARSAVSDEPTIIYNKDTPDAALWGFETESDQTSNLIKHTHMFSFTPTADSSFGAVGRNMPVDSPIEADISIIFENSIGPMAKKRTLKFKRQEPVDNTGSETAVFIVTLEPDDDAPEQPMLLGTTAAGGDPTEDPANAGSLLAVASAALITVVAALF